MQYLYLKELKYAETVSSDREGAEALAREFDESSRREGLKRNRVCPFSESIIHNEEI